MNTDLSMDEFEGEFADPTLAPLLTELRGLATAPAPAIGADLEAVLAGAAPIGAARARRRATTALVVGLVSTGVLAGGISAAAADALPTPVQRVVARVVNSITPFEIPHPDRSGPLPQAPVDDTIQQMIPYLEKGDIIIDGGNSLFTDTERRCAEQRAVMVFEDNGPEPPGG